MLNDPWIDPRDIDWTQSLNPLGNPGWTKNNNPYVHRALKDVYLHALMNAKGIEPRIYVGPEQQNLVIPANSTQDYEVPIEPNFWVYGLTASGTGADFLFNVLDAVSGAQLASQPLSMATMKTLTARRGPIHFLSTSQLYAPPSYPIIRVINNTRGAQTCRVTLFGAIEYDL